MKLGLGVSAGISKMDPKNQDRQFTSLGNVVPPENPAGFVVHSVHRHSLRHQSEALSEKVQIGCSVGCHIRNNGYYLN